MSVPCFPCNFWKKRRLDRRDFLAAITGLMGLAATGMAEKGRLKTGEKRPAGGVMTVEGLIEPDQLGVTLPHEHLLVDFVGADQISPSRYDAEEVFQRVLPYLQQVKQQGCQTLVECTPAYLGRDPLLLLRLACWFSCS